MSITRKSLIKNKYTEFQEILKNNNFDEELALFPSLDDIDVADLTYFLTFTFIGITEEIQFRGKIKELAGMNCLNLSEQKLDILAPMLENFVNWMRNL
jgi:hypothetical protein